jgi:hypothetical protein
MDDGGAVTPSEPLVDRPAPPEPNHSPPNKLLLALFLELAAQHCQNRTAHSAMQSFLSAVGPGIELLPPWRHPRHKPESCVGTSERRMRRDLICS